MTTRSQDRPPQGMEPDDRKTTQQSMIAAIGASGAVIAGGVTTFVLLVGVVSFDVWPMSDAAGLGSGANLELVELAPEPTAEPPAVTVPFGSGALVTEPATVVAAAPPAGEPGCAEARRRPRHRPRRRSLHPGGAGARGWRRGRSGRRRWHHRRRNRGADPAGARRRGARGRSGRRQRSSPAPVPPRSPGASRTCTGAGTRAGHIRCVGRARRQRLGLGPRGRRLRQQRQRESRRPGVTFGLDV